MVSAFHKQEAGRGYWRVGCQSQDLAGTLLSSYFTSTQWPVSGMAMPNPQKPGEVPFTRGLGGKEPEVPRNSPDWCLPQTGSEGSEWLFCQKSGFIMNQCKSLSDTHIFSFFLDYFLSGFSALFKGKGLTSSQATHLLPLVITRKLLLMYSLRNTHEGSLRPGIMMLPWGQKVNEPSRFPYLNQIGMSSQMNNYRKSWFTKLKHKSRGKVSFSGKVWMVLLGFFF